MRKHWIVWLLCALLALGTTAALAEAEPLSLAELMDWRDVVFEGLDANQTPNAVSDDVYVLETAFGAVETTHATLKGQSSDVILHIQLTSDALSDPRGLSVGASVEDVLAAYPGAENIADDGVFCLYATEGEILLWGWGTAKDGQIISLQYSAAQPDPDMEGFYQEAGLVYGFEAGRVTALRAYGLSELIGRDEALANFRSAQSEAAPGDATPFAASDLVFNGLDLTALTPGDIKDALGQPEVDTFIASENLRVLEYSDMMFELDIDPDNAISFYALLVSARTLPGPRGIQVGDTLESVLSRFPNAGEDDLLYGEQDGNTPFGLLTREEDGSVTVRYFIPPQAGVLSRGIMLHLTFQSEVLTEYLIYAQET